MILTRKQTIALDFLEDSTTTELLFGGGAGGGKSVLGVYWIIKQCLRYPGTRWVIGRAVLKTLKETTLKTFFEVTREQGLAMGQHFAFNATSNVITFFNGSEIFLKDLYLYPSDPNFDELGSLEITGAFVDECNQITLKAWEILKSRIRYKLDENGLIQKILGSCNPAQNWVFDRFYVPWERNEEKEGFKFVQSLANDNRFVSKHYIKNLEGLSDESAKARLLHGDWNYLDRPNRIFNWERCDLARYINLNVTEYIGVDWGKVDPWAIVGVKYYDGELYLHEYNYLSENELLESLSTSEIKEITNNEEGIVSWLFNQLKIDFDSEIICDSNRPEKIIALRRAGWEYSLAARKNKGSILDGIDALSRLKVLYTESSKNIENEQFNYSWKTDRYGITMETPEDQYNHSIDAVRYVVSHLKHEGIVNVI